MVHVRLLSVYRGEGQSKGEERKDGREGGRREEREGGGVEERRMRVEGVEERREGVEEGSKRGGRDGKGLSLIHI